MNIGKENKKTSKPKTRDNSRSTFSEELIKLIKKCGFFFNIFNYKRNDNKELKNLHIVFLYDSYNIEDDNSNFINIQKLTEEILDVYNIRFNGFNFIFQLVFSTF